MKTKISAEKPNLTLHNNNHEDFKATNSNTYQVSPRFLNDATLRLIFFGGKGGVGKSTCACASALHIAEKNPTQSILLLSTDPAHSLITSLSTVIVPPNIKVMELDAQSSLATFKQKNEALLKEIADRGTFLDKEDLENLLDLSMPGMDEIAAYLQLVDLIDFKTYDLILVDTAPTGHTLRLIEMPNLVRRWLGALDTLLAKHRYIRRHFTHNTDLDHLDYFILGMNSDINQFESVMTDSALCEFVIIMVAENMSLEESLDLAEALKGSHMPLSEVVINRRLPENSCPVCRDGYQRQNKVLSKHWAELEQFGLWSIPWYSQEPDGQRLGNFWDLVSFVEQKPMFADLDDVLPTHIDGALPLPAENREFMVFAGKGGVGKTTMACATALRIAQEGKHKVLLLSADPANSLSDCLAMNILDRPTQVIDGLDAQEINAEALFAKVRANYRSEVESFLNDALPNLDLTFDREVMQNLLDLAPSGLDEIMALTLLSDHLKSKQYSFIILDSAPSGHMLRLFELPEILDAWFKQFFVLILKYRKVMRLPKISEQLVKYSKDLKFICQLLKDSKRSSLVTVTLPTRVAFAKTQAMLDQLYQKDICLDFMIINQVTPPSDCLLCTTLRQKEKYLIDEYKKGALNVIEVGRQSDPKGISGLIELGRKLYY